MFREAGVKMKKKVLYQWDGAHSCLFCDTDREEKGTMAKCVRVHVVHVVHVRVAQGKGRDGDV